MEKRNGQRKPEVSKKTIIQQLVNYSDWEKKNSIPIFLIFGEDLH